MTGIIIIIQHVRSNPISIQQLQSKIAYVVVSLYAYVTDVLYVVIDQRACRQHK